jgi:hypothetical protein
MRPRPWRRYSPPTGARGSSRTSSDPRSHRQDRCLGTRETTGGPCQPTHFKIDVKDSNPGRLRSASIRLRRGARQSRYNSAQPADFFQRPARHASFASVSTQRLYHREKCGSKRGRSARPASPCARPVGAPDHEYRRDWEARVSGQENVLFLFCDPETLGSERIECVVTNGETGTRRRSR